MAMTRTAGSGRWAPLFATMLTLALLCGLLVYWAMQLLSPPVTIAPTGSLVSQNTSLNTASTGLLFGSSDGKATQADVTRPRVNVKVVGVAASSYRGTAILSIDGKPAQAYGVGQEIDDDLIVKSVTAKEVVLEQNGEEIKVEVTSQVDLAILTSGDNEDAEATSAPTKTQAKPRGRNIRPRTTKAGASRPALAPRRLPPSGAAAAAAAARNTTGVAQPNTPSAARRVTPGRPAASGSSPVNSRPPQNRVTSSRAATQARTRLGSPGKGEQVGGTSQ